MYHDSYSLDFSIVLCKEIKCNTVTKTRMVKGGLRWKMELILIQEYIYWKIGMQKNWYWMCRLIIAVNISFSIDYHLGRIFPTFNSNKFLCWKNENKKTIIYLHTLQHEQLIKHKPDIRCIWPPWQMTNLFHQQRQYHATVVYITVYWQLVTYAALYVHFVLQWEINFTSFLTDGQWSFWQKQVLDE